MHSKSQVRWAGPLEPFAAGFDAELARLGYTPAGTRRKLEAVAHLSRWLAERSLAADDIGAETIGEFVAARRAAGYTSQLTGQSLAWMLDYLRGARRRSAGCGRYRAGDGRREAAGAVRDVPDGRARAGRQDARRSPGFGAPVPGGGRAGR